MLSCSQTWKTPGLRLQERRDDRNRSQAPAACNAREVAEFRRITEASLAQERYKGTGPKFRKLGRKVFYDWADVYAWVDENTMQRTDDRGVA